MPTQLSSSRASSSLKVCPVASPIFLLPRPTCADAALVHVVNFYLDDDRASEREKISALTQSDDRQSELQLEGYVREALSPLS